MFWGLAFVVFGVVLLINQILGWNLPILRILFAVFIIYLGVKMLFGSFGFRPQQVKTDYQAVFSQSDFSFPSKDSTDDKKSYQTIFGESVLDLTNIDLSQGSQSIKIDNVFGKTILRLRKDTPYKVEASVVFGNIHSPDRENASLGDWTDQSDNFNKGENHLLIQADVVFGKLKIELVDVDKK